MNRANKINQVLKLRELANSEYRLGNNAAGKAAMAKAAELMAAHGITRAELAQAAGQQRTPAGPARAAQTGSGSIKTQHVEIKWERSSVTVNGRPAHTEQEVVQILAEEFFGSFMKQFFG